MNMKKDTHAVRIRPWNKVFTGTKKECLEYKEKELMSDNEYVTLIITPNN
jgi:hypothetical protein